MKERKPKKPAYMIFDNEEEYDKYERGEHYDKNGLRGDEGKLVKPVNHIPMTDDDIISEAEKILSKRRREGSLDQEYKEEYYTKQEYSFLEDIWSEVKFILVMKVKEILEDPEKRAIFLARVNSFWTNNLVPAGNKIAKKAKFVKDVVHAALTNEQPRVLKLLEESKKTEAVEVVPDMSCEEPFIEITEEQRNRLAFAIALMADTLRSVKVLNKQGEEYQLTQENKERLLTEKAMEQVQLLLGNDYKMNEATEKFVQECITREVERLPLSHRNNFI
ncbi:hypothetical protein [Faecalimonas umbilicata]|jgi:hypothetical protein|uniref:hypothetical protein n=1 Tax=Faecalimonas umbilicata TaxID=1912855 RepID=UPI000E40FD94|nr:hypothetical protein [Faecalimonas umbilicata]RGC79138.1 hypothetical protein DW669_03740 [Lachnospiraceae bacterium AM25-17]RJU64386.1 hypothetical protein DW709_12480 [Coprococcus sp. AM27-12LB]